MYCKVSFCCFNTWFYYLSQQNVKQFSFFTPFWFIVFWNVRKNEYLLHYTWPIAMLTAKNKWPKQSAHSTLTAHLLDPTINTKLSRVTPEPANWWFDAAGFNPPESLIGRRPGRRARPLSGQGRAWWGRRFEGWWWLPLWRTSDSWFWPWWVHTLLPACCLSAFHLPGPTRS